MHLHLLGPTDRFACLAMRAGLSLQGQHDEGISRGRDLEFSLHDDSLIEKYWQGLMDSNHRMLGSKPSALDQLGEDPMEFGRECRIRTGRAPCGTFS